VGHWPEHAVGSGLLYSLQKTYLTNAAYNHISIEGTSIEKLSKQ
jgi:hypothetical protein